MATYNQRFLYITSLERLCPILIEIQYAFKMFIYNRKKIIQTILLFLR